MPNISKQIIREIIETLDVCGVGSHHPDLLPLLAQPECEPVAHMYPCDLELFATNEPTATAYSVAVGCPDGKSVPLYTSPVPFTPIAPDDVTEEMLDAYFDGRNHFRDPKVVFAACVNAWGAKK